MRSSSSQGSSKDSSRGSSKGSCKTSSKDSSRGSSRGSYKTRSKESSKGSSRRSSMGYSEQIPSRQVQFGVIPRTREYDIEDYDEDTIGSDNVNERLRHQAPIMETVVKTKQLDRVMAGVCTVLLQICYKEVYVLKDTNGMTDVYVNLEYIPLDEKYENFERDVEIILSHDEGCLNYRKLKRDLSWLVKVLWCTIVNLQKHFSFDDFLKILKDDEFTKEEEKMLLGAKKFNKRELEKLRFYIESERAEWTKVIQDVRQKLGNSKYELNYNMKENEITIRYMKEWEKARLEQNKMILQRKEDNIIEVTKCVAIENEREEDVHTEMELFLEDSIQEYKDQIEYWMEKYDKDLEKNERNVQYVKIKLEHQKEKYEALLKKYNERQRQIDEYKKHKLQMKIEAKEAERCNRAATKIQSWWRNVIFKKNSVLVKRRRGKEKKGSSESYSKRGGSAKNSRRKRK